LYDEIKKHALISQTFMIDVECVDKYNVKEASKYGMKELIINSNIKPDICLIDYEKIEINKMKTISYTKGDEKCFSIAAASILAKVERDRYMENVHKKYPNYGFNRHVGYGTKLHSDMIKKYGIINNLHRKSFKPIIKLMSN
jgi:ribonuclease HII